MNQEKIDTITINDVEYVRKDSIQPPFTNNDNVAIVVSARGGIHFGEITSTDITHASVKMKNSRRICYWAGAASVSQIAMEGFIKPGDCRIAMSVPVNTVFEVVEVIPCTLNAIKNISQVKVWKI